MGGKHSKGKESQSSAPSLTAEPKAQSQEPAPKHEQPVPLNLDVKVLGVGDAESAQLLLTSDLRTAIARSLGPEYLSHGTDSAEWVLLFNSNCHGKSFVRLIQHVCDRGPVLIAIRDVETQRVFGGFNESAWRVVATREREAKSAAAAAARAAREGVAVEASRPSNQSRLFFGTDRSFLFSDTLPNGTKVTSSENVPIYRSRSESAGGNGNYMYLFDVHPDDDKIGIGMGGQAGQFGWFLDRYLEKGFCKGPRCSTYGNPLLVPLEEWSVDVVEAYAVHPRDVDELKAALAESTIKEGRTIIDKQGVKKPSIMHRGSETNCDKMLLELDMQHQFRGEEVASSDGSDHGGDTERRCPPMYD
jgi:hypothetical protein